MVTSEAELHLNGQKRAENIAAAALRTLPHFEQARISLAQVVAPVASPMHCGVDADGWRVDLDDNVSYFLKLYTEETAEFLDLPISFKAAQSAAWSNVSPQLVWCDEALRAAMWEYCGAGWKTAVFDDTRRTGIVANVAHALRTLHAGPLLGTARNPFDSLDRHIETARVRQVKLPADFAWMLSNVRDIASAIRAAGVDMKPCHGDLLASNIIIGPGMQVNLVDWDEASDGDPCWDLGTYFAEAFPFDEPALTMLEDYCGRADRKMLARCRLYGMAGDLAWAVRSLILAHQTRRTDIEYFKYGQWRALRCRVALHDPKFEQMLRSI